MYWPRYKLRDAASSLPLTPRLPSLYQPSSNTLRGALATKHDPSRPIVPFPPPPLHRLRYRRATDEHKTVNIDFLQNGGDAFCYNPRNPGHNQPTNGYSRTISKSVHTTHDVSNFSKKSIEIRHQREKVKLFQQKRNHQWKLVRRSILTLPGDDLEQELQPHPVAPFPWPHSTSGIPTWLSLRQL